MFGELAPVFCSSSSTRFSISFEIASGPPDVYEGAHDLDIDRDRSFAPENA